MSAVRLRNPGGRFVVAAAKRRKRRRNPRPKALDVLYRSAEGSALFTVAASGVGLAAHGVLKRAPQKVVPWAGGALLGVSLAMPYLMHRYAPPKFRAQAVGASLYPWVASAMHFVMPQCSQLLPSPDLSAALDQYLGDDEAPGISATGLGPALLTHPAGLLARRRS